MTLFNYLSTSALTLLGAAQLFAQTATTATSITRPQCQHTVGQQVYCADGLYENLCFAIQRNPDNAKPGACVFVGGPDVPRVAMPNGTDQAVEVARRPDTDCAYTIGQQVYCTDGRLYQNLCFAIKRNPANAAPGACTHVPDGSTIPRIAMPNGTDQAVEVARRPDYACLDVYDPVCANGVTYGNACYASLAGVTSWTKGACGSTEAEYRTALPATTTDAIAVDCLRDPHVRIYCPISGLYYRDMCAAKKAGETPSACYPVSNPDVPRVAMPTDETQTIEVARRPDYHCIDVYAPVCANGVTYGNSCYASLAGETSWTKGACDGSDSPVEFRQANHSNSTAAIRLRPDYDCLAVYDPVCANGVTYGNSCYASLAGVTSWTKGACESEVLANISIRPRPCPMIYAPVCGNDGITYANSCIAREAGVTSWTNGACDKAELELRKGSANGFSNDYRVLVYPNPTSTIVNVQIQDAAAQSIRLYNLAGQLVREQQNINANQVEISVADLANGIYTISVITEKGTRNERVQVQH